MIKINEWVNELYSLGIKLWVENESLCYRIPKSQKSRQAEILSELKLRKQEIVDYLTQNTIESSSMDSISVVDRDSALSLSFAQEQLWFLDQLEERRSAAYSVPIAFRLHGSLDLELFEQSMLQIVQRQEALHICFPDSNGKPTVKINPADLNYKMVDLSDLQIEEKAERTKVLVNDEIDSPFDLQNGPLFRLQVHQWSSVEFVVVLNMHHIISDGWSVGIVIDEFCQIYSALKQGKDPKLPEMKVQYLDYARWQRDWLNHERIEKEFKFWEQQLERAPKLLQLPLDRPRPAIKRYIGKTKAFRLNNDVSDAMKELCKQYDCTAFMALLASWYVLLSRYSGENDIVIGCPIANRSHPDTESLVGFFINTLAMRIESAGESSFVELLRDVKTLTLDVFANQDIPFDQLVTRLQPERSLNHTPVFQAVFALQNEPLGELTLPDLTLEEYEIDIKTSKFDLTLSLTEDKDGFTGLLEYDSDLFEETTIERMGVHFCNLVSSITKNPECSLAQLNYISAEEKDEILKLSHSKENYDLPEEPLIKQFEYVAWLRTDHVAIVDDENRLSLGELNQKANQLAHYLIASGIQREELVGIHFDRSADMIISILGIVKAGASYVPIDTKQPLDRFKYMVEDAGINLVITQKSLSNEIREIDARFLLIDSEWNELIANNDTSNPEQIDATPEDLVYAIYTSGSTGLPKCVGIPHHGLNNLVTWQKKKFNLSYSDRTLWSSGTGFDASVYDLWPALISATRIHIVKDGLSPEEIQQFILSKRISKCFLATPLAEALLKLDWPEDTAFRHMIVGGDRLHLYPSENLPFRLYNAYGPTENSVISTLGLVSPERSFEQLPTIGSAISNTTIFVLDANLEQVPVGIPGELYVGGEGLARGYLGKAALTAEHFIPNPYSKIPGARLYQTGDQVRLLSDGSLEFLGRIDRQVKIRGFRIELGEVEGKINAINGIRKAVVDTIETQAGTKQLVAWILESKSISDQEILDSLKDQLPEYMIPSIWERIDDIPLTGRGKIDYKKLPSPALEVGQEEYIAPRTFTQKQIAHIWNEILGLDRASICQNFFHLGGHSLLATQVISRVRSSFKIDMALKAIFEHPTIERLSVQVDLLIGQDVEEKIEPCNLSENRPLSYAQERLWFLDKLVPDSSFYNIPISLRLDGNLNQGALEKAFQSLVRRHEALHCCFSEKDGAPVLTIDSDLQLRLQMVDLKGVSESEQRLSVKRILHEQAHRAFDISQAPLIRVSLIQLSEQSHVLLIIIHHIIADGWSVGILGNEISALYERFKENQNEQLPRLDIQYSDFSVWQRRFLSGDRLEKQLTYWKNQLSNLEVLNLPTDKPRPSVATYTGASESIFLTKELCEKLDLFCQEMDTSLYMTLLAAFSILLSRYSGQKNLAIGSPIANRNRKEIEPLIGFFVNTLTIRLNLEKCSTVRELLQHTRKTTLEAFDYQDVPFEHIVHELKPVRDMSRNPLFQVLFALQNANSNRMTLNGLEISPMDLENMPVRLDLEFHTFESDDGLEATMIYNTDLFHADTIQHFLSGWRIILDQMLEDPDAKINQLQILSPFQEVHLLKNWNGKESGTKQVCCMHELFESQVNLTPDRVCLIFGEDELSYSELDDRANRLAAWFQMQGLGPEKLIGVCLNQSIERIVVTLALHKAGAAFLPIDLRFPEERLRYMIEDAGITSMIAFSEQAKKVCELNPDLEILEIDHIESNLSEDIVYNKPCLSSDHLAYVIYTSGSTGQPKGIAMRHEVITNLVQFQIELSRQANPVRTLQFAPLIFDIVFQEMFATWHVGGTLVLASEEDRANPERLVYLLNSQKIERFFLPYIALCSLAESDDLWELENDCLKEVITAGEQLQISDEIATFFRKRPYCRLYNQYGPSECHVVTHYSLNQSVDHWEKLPPIGRAIDNLKIYILDEALNLVPPRAIGEVFISGPCLARGYLNKPALTAEAFIPNPFASEADAGSRLYKTGDLAFYNNEGQIEFVGRSDHQVKIRGYRIELSEVEVVATQHPSVKAGVATVEEVGEGNRHLVLYIVFDPDADTIKTDDLKDYLAEWLPDYMIPTYIVELDQLPVTTGGKVDRKCLPKISDAMEEAIRIAPRNDLEERLCQIWQELLDISSIGIRDNFFDLGGNSLMAVRLMASLKKEWKINFPLSMLFQNPTIESIAVVISQSGHHLPSESILVPLQTEGTETPVFMMHPGSGRIFCYQDIIKYVDDNQPLYAIQHPGFVDNKNLPSSVGEMAELYIDAIKTIQPKGPYHIGGWCQGGVIAFEMASRLQTRGESVNRLFMFNSYAPEYDADNEDMSESRVFKLFLKHLTHFDENIVPREVDELVDREDTPFQEVLNINRRHPFLPENFNKEEFIREFTVFSAIVRAVMTYELSEYKGDLSFYKAADSLGVDLPDPCLGWEPHVKGCIFAQTIPGHHYTMMEEPNVVELIKKWSHSTQSLCESSN